MHEITLGNLPVGAVVRDQSGYTEPWIVLSQSHFGEGRTLLWEQETRIERAFSGTFTLSWRESQMRDYLRTEFYAGLSEDFQASVVESTTYTDDEINTDETLFILSLSELGEEHLYTGNTPPATNHGSKIEGVDDYLYSNHSYWTRSTYNPMTIYFYYSEGNGRGHVNFTGNHVSSNRVRAAVNLQSDTVVYGPYGEEGFYTLFDPHPFWGGSGTLDNPYLIASARHLHNIRHDLDAHYRIVRDIDLAGFIPDPIFDTGLTWVPIGHEVEGGFEGSLDGGGHTITGLTISAPGSDQALFGHISPQGSVSHLYLEDVELLLDLWGVIAGLAARNEGVIHNVHVTGQLHGDSYVGGLVGLNRGTITASSAQVQISGGDYSGGLVGDNRGSISQSFTRGTVEGKQHAGGLVGFNFAGTIRDSFSEVIVQGTEAVGGLTGYNSGTAQVESSYASGSAAGEVAVGGLIGNNYGSVTASYWNESAYDGEPPINHAGERVTAEALKRPSTFVGWDFDTVWYAYPDKVPFLQWMDPLQEVEVTTTRPWLSLRNPIAQIHIVTYHESGDAYDVTETARYEVTEGEAIIEVDDKGQVTAKSLGGAVITIRISGEVRTVPFNVGPATVDEVAWLTPLVTEPGTARSELVLPEQVEITVDGGEKLEAGITWDDGTPVYNGEEAGVYWFTGELTLPSDVENPWELSAAIMVLSMPVPELPAIVVPYGTERSALPLPEKLEDTMEDGETVIVDITWNDGTPSYNGQQAGTYTFEGELQIDIGYGSSVTAKVRAAVTVQARASEPSQPSQPGPIFTPPVPPSPDAGSPGADTPGGDSSHEDPDSDTDVLPQEPEQPETPTPWPVFEPSDLEGHWAADSVRRLIALGAIGGYPDHTFRPDAGITRAEFVTVLVRALQLEARTGRRFQDTEQHWAAESIAAAHEQGWITGYTESRFGPNDPITREQMARILQQAFDIQGAIQSPGSFTDTSDISAWATAAIAALAQHGILSGYPDQSFRPKQGATRAEAAEILMRVLQLDS
ncbi:S-layer homology domain-containing protein [Paenibacillus sp. 1P07SE]|uniref:S-layer homology domain-containing protein n=1 Tax=Paenibacillus sp. 1P07SE TaxID=3132209 RepID=UPI0039A6B18D